MWWLLCVAWHLNLPEPAQFLLLWPGLTGPGPGPDSGPAWLAICNLGPRRRSRLRPETWLTPTLFWTFSMIFYDFPISRSGKAKSVTNKIMTWSWCWLFDFSGEGTQVFETFRGLKEVFNILLESGGDWLVGYDVMRATVTMASHKSCLPPLIGMLCLAWVWCAMTWLHLGPLFGDKNLSDVELSPLFGDTNKWPERNNSRAL